jgi:predicted DNA repair protein MutK
VASSNATHTDLAAKQIDSPSFEKDKIRGAMRTDFVLPTEIIVIALGTVAQAASNIVSRMYEIEQTEGRQ